VERLKDLGHSNVAIAKKIGVSDSFITGLLTLVKAGEERLVKAGLTGAVPFWVAIDIAKTDGPEAQRELLKAYENKQLTSGSLRVIKRLIDQRRIFGKSRSTGPRGSGQAPTADSFVNAYRRETERQRALVQKAAIAEERLLFVVTALKALLADEDFTNLLRAEDLDTIPEFLAARIRKNTRRERTAA
jgi:ParB family chromosome partitioning protein